MKASVTIPSVFPGHCFWEMDYSRLDAERDSDIIIPRALYFTDDTSFEADISKLEIFYTPQQILERLRKTKELISNEVCEMVAERYQVPSFLSFLQVIFAQGIHTQFKYKGKTTELQGISFRMGQT